MDAKSHQSKRRDATISSLNAAIEGVNLAKDSLGMTPAKAAFGSVGVILTTIRVGILPVGGSRLLANVYRTQ